MLFVQRYFHEFSLQYFSWSFFFWVHIGNLSVRKLNGLVIQERHVSRWLRTTNYSRACKLQSPSAGGPQDSTINEAMIMVQDILKFSKLNNFSFSHVPRNFVQHFDQLAMRARLTNQKSKICNNLVQLIATVIQFFRNEYIDKKKTFRTNKKNTELALTTDSFFFLNEQLILFII